MKWITKRARLISDEKMYSALSRVLVDFVGKLQSEQKVGLWYTSLKNNDGLPSFRVYLQATEDEEESIRSAFLAFMENNKVELGWTGQFIDPDPGVPGSEVRISEINKACDLVLQMTKHFPESDRRQSRLFWSAIKTEYLATLPSVVEEHRSEFFHFLANNLAIPDRTLLNILQRV